MPVTVTGSLKLTWMPTPPPIPYVPFGVDDVTETTVGAVAKAPVAPKDRVARHKTASNFRHRERMPGAGSSAPTSASHRRCKEIRGSSRCVRRGNVFGDMAIPSSKMIGISACCTCARVQNDLKSSGL